MVGNRQPMMPRRICFQNHMAAFLVDLPVAVMLAKQFDQLRAAASCAGQKFIPHQMQPHSGEPGLIEEKRGHRLAHILAQLLPLVALREDVVRETLGHVAAVAFLRHAEDDFHGRTIAENGRKTSLHCEGARILSQQM